VDRDSVGIHRRSGSEPCLAPRGRTSALVHCVLTAVDIRHHSPTDPLADSEFGSLAVGAHTDLSSNRIRALPFAPG